MTENFSELLENSKITEKKVRFGTKVQGKIVGFDDSSVFFDIGAKIDAYVEKMELSDENGKFNHKIGEEMELYVVSNKESEIRLSKALGGDGGFNLIKDAFERNIPVSGKVKGVIKGGFEVSVMGKRSFCPFSQIDIKKVERPEDHIGCVYNFKVTTFEEKGKNVVVSRQAILQEEQKAVIEKLMAELEKVDVITGKVTKVTNFGAFVEIKGGLEGLVHISEIAWTHVTHASEILKPGDVVTAKILKIEPGENRKPPRISMSIKQLLAHPWLSVEKLVKVGDKIKGKVTRCVDFGAFIEVFPGIEGLAHISELSAEKRVNKTSEILAPGDIVEVVVMGIDLEKKKMSLSIKEINREAVEAARSAEREQRNAERDQKNAEWAEQKKAVVKDENDWRNFSVVGDASVDEDENPFSKLKGKFGGKK